MKTSKLKNAFILSLTMAAGLVYTGSSCQRKEFHIYSDPAYGVKVEKRFEEKKNMAAQRNDALFGVFNPSLSQAETEGLKFLYAFMPLSDLADYQGEFFLNQVKWSLAARDTFAWGKTIPEDVFRHFVLPYRVNNENLDTARIVIFKELKSRIRNMGMLEAALEVNHWCHEKVTYRGSDIRTSAPPSHAITSKEPREMRCKADLATAVRHRPRLPLQRRVCPRH